MCVVAIGAAYGVSAGASPAAAHFRLTKPASWIVEDGLGDPQKTSPCGPAGMSYTASNAPVPTFEAGETITVEWSETIAHPGHFRIALARDRADLIDPDIDYDGLCNHTGFEDQTGVYPVLLDNLFPRTGFPAADSFVQEVTLPNEPCENCTLQVIQFMTSHTPGCMYYHCANINVVAAGGAGDAGVAVDAGLAGTGGAGGAPMTGGMSGAPMTTGGVGGAAGTVAPVAGTTGGVGGAAGVNAGMVGAGTGAVAGSAGATGGAPASPNDESSGCRVAQSGSGVSTLGLLGLALLLVRRRRALRA